MTEQVKRRAIGIIRVSVSRGEDPSSPKDQRDILERLAAEQGWELEVYEPELNVSGDARLDKRPSLSRAVMAVQTGAAQVIAAAHTERLWWNHETAAQVIRLVEDANGEVWSADQGLLTRRSAADEFSGTVRTAADRLSRRQNAEKTAAAQQRAVARGAIPWSNVTPGYRRKEDGTLEPDEKAPAVAEAFQMRADGATIAEVRARLAEHGIVRSYRAVQMLLSSRVVLGEIHFGSYEPNLEAHEPIVDREVWQRVQRMVVPRGRPARSNLLLVRLGVVRCGTCGWLMVGGSQVQGERRYPFYRCPNGGDCKGRVSISARVLDEIVVSRVREALADEEGRASAEQGVREAVGVLEKAQGDLGAALRAFAGLEDEEAARDRLVELRQARDEAQAKVDRLGGQGAAARAVTVDDWGVMTHDERRDLVRVTVESVTVAPGRGEGRVAVHLFGEKSAGDAV